MTAVCAEAGLTERYFYESFADREALLLAVFDRITHEATEAILAAISASAREARARTRAAITAFVELMTDDPRKGRVAFVEAMGSEALVRRRYESISAFAALLGDQARDFYGMPTGGDELIELTEPGAGGRPRRGADGLARREPRDLARAADRGLHRPVRGHRGDCNRDRRSR